MKNIKLIFTLIFVGLLTACASAPIDHEALRAQKIDTITFTANKVLGHTVASSATPTVYGNHGSFSKGAAEGFVASLIVGALDAGINAKRKKSFVPILNSIKDYDAKSVFEKKLSILKGDIFSNNLTVLELETQYSEKQSRKLHDLSVVGSFALAPNHRSVTTTITADLSVNKKNDLNGSSWLGVSKLDMGGTKVTKADVTQFWVDNPKELQKHIEESMDEALGKMVTYFSTKKPE